MGSDGRRGRSRFFIFLWGLHSLGFGGMTSLLDCWLSVRVLEALNSVTYSLAVAVAGSRSSSVFKLFCDDLRFDCCLEEGFEGREKESFMVLYPNEREEKKRAIADLCSRPIISFRIVVQNNVYTFMHLILRIRYNFSF